MKLVPLIFCFVLFFQFYIIYSEEFACICSAPGCNPANNCTCFSDADNGFWKEKPVCDECQTNFDIKTNCTKCSENFYGATCKTSKYKKKKIKFI